MPCAPQFWRIKSAWAWRGLCPPEDGCSHLSCPQKFTQSSNQTAVGSALRAYMIPIQGRAFLLGQPVTLSSLVEGERGSVGNGATPLRSPSQCLCSLTSWWTIISRLTPRCSETNISYQDLWAGKLALCLSIGNFPASFGSTFFLWGWGGFLRWDSCLLGGGVAW